MSATLFCDKNTPRGQIVVALAAKNGFNIKIEQEKTNEYLSTFPLHKRPALLFENGDTLTETIAIAQYFGNESPYMGKDKLGKTKVLSWLSFVNTDMVQGIISMFQSGENLQSLKKASESIVSNLAYLENIFKNKKYLVGDSETAADLYLMYFLDLLFTRFATVVGEITTYPALHKWHTAVKSAQ